MTSTACWLPFRAGTKDVGSLAEVVVQFGSIPLLVNRHIGEQFRELIFGEGLFSYLNVLVCKALDGVGVQGAELARSWVDAKILSEYKAR